MRIRECLYICKYSIYFVFDNNLHDHHCMQATCLIIIELQLMLTVLLMYNWSTFPVFLRETSGRFATLRKLFGWYNQIFGCSYRNKYYCWKNKIILSRITNHCCNKIILLEEQIFCSVNKNICFYISNQVFSYLK